MLIADLKKQLESVSLTDAVAYLRSEDTQFEDLTSNHMYMMASYFLDGHIAVNVEIDYKQCLFQILLYDQSTQEEAKIVY